ncbi:MAG: hypothetical protein JXR27_08085 [Paludibacteraceae bacterium]|nr:hypothetical protein [Paludibacteraceae bacterium]
MKVLVCPLNWGLGHATRCIPIIRQLLAEGHEPVLVSDGYPLECLRMQFPDLRYIEYPSYSVRYSSGISQVFAMLWNMPSIIYGIVSEHRWLENLLKTEHFDQVISDNRFGLWNGHIKSVYITHQMMIKIPRGLKLFEGVLWRLHRWFIKHYDECWIPDFEGNENLSGDLSHKYRLPNNAKFIGPLSRFDIRTDKSIDNSYEIVAVLSGVEPQRSIFEHQIIDKYRRSGKDVLIVCGQPAVNKRTYHVGDVTLVSHLADDELVPLLRGADKIISRSGYSTIMDLYTLGCLHKAEMSPIPGQTEQEYLKSKMDGE